MTQRTALVIGSGSGVSDAVAFALLADGHRVAITNSEAKPANMLGLQCDLADGDSIETVFQEVEREFGPVQILVVDAGVLRDSHMPGGEGSESRQAPRIRLQAAFVAAKRATGLMRQARWGRMIFLASSLAMPTEIAPIRYAAFSIEAGLVGLAERLSGELAVDNIVANVIVPGLVEDEKMLLNPGTRKHPMWHIPAQRAGRPSEIASAVSFLASDNAAYVNGATLRVDGGIGIPAWES